MNRFFRCSKRWQMLAGLAAAVTGILVPAASAEAQLDVIKLNDSVVDANAMLMPSTAPWGRAINGASFQAEALLTFNGYQYTAWYTHDADLSAMIARRTVSGDQVGTWEIVSTGSKFEYGAAEGWDQWNAHNVISLGISQADGRIHLSWDQHDWRGVRYRATAAGVATDNPGAWGASMFAPEQSKKLGDNTINSSTYPTFINTPDGGLHFAYRTNQSGNGDVMLSTYADGAWSTPALLIGRSGQYVEGSLISNSRNGYYNGLDYGPDGTLHMTWTWRETSDGANHDINYAYSEDGGVTWKNNAGVIVADLSAGDALTISDPGLVIQTLDLKQGLRNQQSQAVDASGRVHVLMTHRRQEPGYEWQSGDNKWALQQAAHYHYVRDPVTGAWMQYRLPVEIEVDGVTEPVLPGTRPSIGYDAQGNVFAVYTNRQPGDNNPYNAGDLIIAGATATANYADWSILHIEMLGDGVGFIGEPQIDQARLLNDGILSIFVQEDDPSVPGLTGTRLHVLEYSVVIPEPASAMLLGAGLYALIRRARSPASP